MGVLPLQFPQGVNRKTLKLNGVETFDLNGLSGGVQPRMTVTLVIQRADDATESVPLLCRIDTLDEVEYYRNGGILHYVLRQLLAA